MVSWATVNRAVAVKEARGKGSAEVQENRRRLTLGRLASRRVNVSAGGACVLRVFVGSGFAGHHGMQTEARVENYVTVCE